MNTRLVCQHCGAVNIDPNPQADAAQFRCGRCGRQELRRQTIQGQDPQLGMAALGAMVGAALGGPAGAVVGGVFGALLGAPQHKPK